MRNQPALSTRHELTPAQLLGRLAILAITCVPVAGCSTIQTGCEKMLTDCTYLQKVEAGRGAVRDGTYRLLFGDQPHTTVQPPISIDVSKKLPPLTRAEIHPEIIEDLFQYASRQFRDYESPKQTAEQFFQNPVVDDITKMVVWRDMRVELYRQYDTQGRELPNYSAFFGIQSKK